LAIESSNYRAALHRAHMKPALQSVHWLPVNAQIEFKVATMMHAIFHQCGLAYLSNVDIKFSTKESGHCQLCSSTIDAAVILRTFLFEMCVFFVCLFELG